jgi:hypothetical protein
VVPLGHFFVLTTCGPISCSCPAGPAGWVDRFAGKPRKGSDILVQALEREGVDTRKQRHVLISGGAWGSMVLCCEPHLQQRHVHQNGWVWGSWVFAGSNDMCIRRGWGSRVLGGWWQHWQPVREHVNREVGTGTTGKQCDVLVQALQREDVVTAVWQSHCLSTPLRCLLASTVLGFAHLTMAQVVVAQRSTAAAAAAAAGAGLFLLGNHHSPVPWAHGASKYAECALLVLSLGVRSVCVPGWCVNGDPPGSHTQRDH